MMTSTSGSTGAPTGLAASALERKLGAKLRRNLEDRAEDAAAGDVNHGDLDPVAKAESLYRDGVAMLRRGQQREAVAAFSRSIFLIPSEPLPYVARGEAFAAACDFRSAVANFRKALTLLRDPVVAEDVKMRTAHLLDAMGVSCLRRGEIKRAMHFFADAKTEQEEAVFELHRCLCLVGLNRPKEAEVALTALLHVAEETQQSPAAASGSPRSSFEAGGQSDVSESPKSAEERADSTERRSDAADEEDDVDAQAREAVRKAQLAVDAEARVLLVHLALQTGDFAKARAMLESCLERHYTHPRVQDMEQRFDETFQQLRDDSEASLDVDGLTRCIACFPDDADLYRIRAIAYIQKKAYTLAVQDLFGCLQKSGGTSPVASALLASTLATIADELSEAEDYAAAVNYYAESLKWDTTSIDVHVARGDCHVQLGKHEAALLDYKHSLAIDPTSKLVKGRLARLHDTWGMILYNQARYQIAEAEFTRALGYDDTDPVIPYHRATCRMMLKDQLGTVRDLILCKGLNPTDPAILKLVNQFCGTAQPGQAAPAVGAEVQTPTQHRTHGAGKPKPKRSLGARLGLPIQAGSLLRGVKDASMVEAVTTSETTVSGLRTDRGSLLQQQYDPQLIRAAAAPKAPKPKPSDEAGGTGSTSAQERQPPPEPAKASGARQRLWAGSSKIADSRLDRVQVSGEQPIPEHYLRQRAQRELREADDMARQQLEIDAAVRERKAHGQSGNAPPAPAGVVQARNRRPRVQPRGSSNAVPRDGNLGALLSAGRVN